MELQHPAGLGCQNAVCHMLLMLMKEAMSLQRLTVAMSAAMRFVGAHCFCTTGASDLDAG